MSIKLKESVDIPRFDNANDRLGWMITKWKNMSESPRGFVILDKTDLKQIIQAYDSIEGKLCQNECPESKESEMGINRVYEEYDYLLFNDPLELLAYISSLPDDGYTLDASELLMCKRAAKKLEQEVLSNR